MSTIHRFDIGGKILSSVVVSEEEWDFLIDMMKTMNRVAIKDGGRITDAQLEHIRKSKHIPMIARGTLTEKVFQHLGVEDALMSVIVRGMGPSVYNDLISTKEAPSLN
jgi:hypothetical protein